VERDDALPLTSNWRVASHKLAPLEGGNVNCIQIEPLAILSLGSEPLMPVFLDP
jgi:hypothetical protein